MAQGSAAFSGGVARKASKNRTGEGREKADEIGTRREKADANRTCLVGIGGVAYLARGPTSLSKETQEAGEASVV